MGVQQVKLESVRRKTGGRIHLTPRVPKSGTVTTLCRQTLAAGTFAAAEEGADRTHRSQHQGRISGAFFAQDEGSELLKLSLEQARLRRPPTKPPASAPDKAVARPAPKPPPARTPKELGELVTRGFRPSGEGVWRSPGGVVVKMKKQGKKQGESWKFEGLVFEGSIIATRAGEGIRVKAGDVEVNPTKDGYEVQLTKK